MVSTKRALAIGSSYDDLPGTENDVKIMVGILEKYGFQKDNIQTLCGAGATRQNILDAWEELILKSSSDDSVVIYYSGHGGLAELKEDPESQDVEEPKRIQFLVPSDYDSSLKNWRGILDSEISKLLLDTTRKTTNVTYILDCCHSARLGRKPLAHHPVPKALSTSDYPLVLEHFKQLRKQKKLLENDCWTNPNVVRIAAAADRESAWQYQKKGEHVGILTEKLQLVIGEQGVKFSWRNIMVGVSALVEREFAHDQKPQQPRSAGADTRIPFAMEIDWSKAFVAEILDKHTIIEGGRVHGISQADSFTLTPLMPDWKIEATNSGSDALAITTVKQVQGFFALASKVPKKSFPYTWAWARSHHRHHRWPVAFPENLGHISTLVEKSGVLEFCEPGKEPLIEFRLEGKEGEEMVALYGRGLLIGSREPKANSDIEELFSMASKFAEAQDVLSFERGRGDEELRSDVQIEIGVVNDDDEELKASHCTAERTEPETIQLKADEEYYIRLENKGTSTIYVSVLRVDAAGKITLVSRAWEKGIELSKEAPRKLLATSSLPLEGIALGWPRSVPRQESVREAFVFVITNEEIDLGSFQTSTPQDYFFARARNQRLTTASRRTAINYDVARIHYNLHSPTGALGDVLAHAAEEDEAEDDTNQKLVTSAELPLPEETKEWEALTSDLQERAAASKGLLDAAIRIMKGIPPCVWVINEHNEDITVVVSKYRPNRLLTAGGLNASSTGAGFNFETTTFKGPATTKTLAPQARDPEGSIATFPLWTRKDGFGVISIFTGSDKKLYIENDLIPIGATAYFRNKPNLKIVHHDEREG